MDYSSLHNDADHPSGTSPWASPQPNSAGFSTSTASDPPSSPSRHNVTSESQDQPEYMSPYLPSVAGSSHAQLTDDVREGGKENVENGLHSPQTGEPGFGGQQTHPQAHEHKSQPQRYHGPARTTPQRTNVPQYKLQAKITGLERTGRKDPILRFDVHVCHGIECRKSHPSNDWTDTMS